jgi:hypothetical protein
MHRDYESKRYVCRVETLSPPIGGTLEISAPESYGNGFDR